MRKIVIGGITLGALLIVGGVRIADLWWSRTKTLTAAESRAANLALILSEYINEAFAAGDASLRQLVIHSGRIGGPAASDSEWAPSLASARAGLTDITSISVVDAEGVIRHSTLAENTAAHRAGTGDLASASRLCAVWWSCTAGASWRRAREQVAARRLPSRFRWRENRPRLPDRAADRRHEHSFMPVPSRTFLNVGSRTFLHVRSPTDVHDFLSRSFFSRVPVNGRARTERP